MKSDSGAILCWGEVLWDMFPDGPQLGGAVANVAFHLGKLGAPVQLVSRIGDDELGREAVSRLEAVGVDCSLVQVDPKRPTGQVNVELEAGEPRYTLSAHAAWEYIELTAGAREALGSAGYLSVGTLAQRRQEGRSSMADAIAAKSDACKLVVDANVRPVHLDHAWLGELMRAAAVVKINEAEAELISKELAGGGDALDWLHGEAGVELVALTRGAHGCMLSTVSESAEHPGHAATPGGDNVGAGDSFVAVLLYGLSQGWPLADIAERGNRYAAWVASNKGATPARPA